MEKQNEIIELYFKTIKGKDTYREISEDTGIQITRIFRILNGSKMKICELEIFEKIIASRTAGYKFSKEFQFKQIFDVIESFGPDDLQELNQFIDTKRKK